MDGRLRRTLTARSHALKPAVVTDAAGVNERVVAHVAALLAHHDLLKVKLRAPSSRECDVAAQALASRAGAALVRRTGRVALLYRARADGVAEAESAG